MKFYVIYSLDMPRSCYINRYAPSKKVRRKLTLTEGDSEYEYGYLEGEWKHGKHRKWVGLLSRKDFEQLIDDCPLYASSTETMGSLTEFGWMPAINFDSEADVIENMYVTPVVEDSKGNEREGMTERDWERVRRAMLNTYSNGGTGGHGRAYN